VISKIH